MSPETVITIGCIVAGAAVLLWSFRTRAVRAETSLARVEAEINRTSAVLSSSTFVTDSPLHGVHQ